METLLQKTAEKLRTDLGTRFEDSRVEFRMCYGMGGNKPDSLTWSIFIDGIFAGKGCALDTACTDALLGYNGKEFIPVE